MRARHILPVVSVLSIFILFLIPAPAAADSIYVAPDGDDGGTGGPGDPFATLQHAVTVSAPGGTIRLYDGTFSGPGNREVDLQAKPLWITSVSGDPATCVIDCGGLDGLLFEEDEFVAPGDTLAITGIRFTNADVAVRVGHETITHGPVTRGCVLRDLVFDDVVRALELRRHVVRLRNVDISATDQGIHGIYLYGEMDDLRIVGAATGLYCSEHSAVGGSLVLRDSELLHNGYGFDGGTEFEIVEFVDCRVDSNSIAGIRLNSGELGKVSLLRTSVNHNEGHGVWIQQMAGLDAAESEIVGNAGSGIHVEHSLPCYVTLDDMEIHDNGAWGIQFHEGFFGSLTMRTTSLRGNGAGGCRTSVHSVHVEESLIVDNRGTGLWLAPPLPRFTPEWDVTSTTIADNDGHGLHSELAGGSVANTLVADNDSLGFSVADTTGLTIACTDIHGNAGGDWTEPIFPRYFCDGNFWEDPCFCDPAGGNYHLCGTSPCLPEGSPAVCTGVIGALGQGCGTPSGVDLPEAIPSAHRLVGAYPNPFNPLTTVVYELPGPAVVTLKVFDPRGRLVRVLEDRRPRGPGRHEVEWRGRDLQGRAAAAGVYLVRLEAGRFADTRRLTLIR